MDTGSAREIIRLKVAESSNLVALELGEKGAATGTVVVAELQTGGRGRLNRSWLSPPGTGLYFSIILRPALAQEDLPKITLTAGLALCKTVEATYSLKPMIKWPNDLLLNEKKFGGILTETGSLARPGSEENPLVVVGVGLNLLPPHGGFPADLRKRATALSEHAGQDVDMEKLLLGSVASVEREVQRLEQGEFSEILLEWSQRDAVRGRKLTWVTPGGKPITGISLGPDTEGVLCVKDQEGEIHEVISGDVKLVGKAQESKE